MGNLVGSLCGTGSASVFHRSTRCERGLSSAAGYKNYFTRKWHLGEADYALPIAQGYDEMKYCGLYHLNAYAYADRTWFPDMDPELRAMFQRVTKGSMSGKAGENAKEDFKINGQYVDTPDKGMMGFDPHPEIEVHHDNRT